LVASGQNFDLVLTDLRMPDIDGMHLAKGLRDRLGHRAMPVLLMSSLRDREGLEQLGLLAGFVTKPVKPGPLLAMLVKLCPRRPTGLGVVVAAAISAATAPGRGPVAAELPAAMPMPEPATEVADAPSEVRKTWRILVAEDNRVNQRVALQMLRRIGYTAEMVGNGRLALEAHGRAPFDIILMDVEMPEMDGREAARQLRQQSGPRHPWIIALTANAMPGDRDVYLADGMNDYLAKPMKLEEMGAVLQRARPG
jgi:CheY-like chemotaxis protein